jgi:hypothetical protein
MRQVPHQTISFLGGRAVRFARREDGRRVVPSRVEDSAPDELGELPGGVGFGSAVTFCKLNGRNPM